MPITSRARLLPLLLVAALGCTESTDPRRFADCGLLGTVNISVTGAATTTVDGCAAYFLVPASTTVSATFSTSLTENGINDPGADIGFQRQGGRPAVGSYTVGTGAGQMTGAFVQEGGATYAFTSGTITISTSTAGTVGGTVSVVATGGPTGTATVNLSGSFSARCIETADTDC